jgi:hypothetical protein
METDHHTSIPTLLSLTLALWLGGLLAITPDCESTDEPAPVHFTNVAKASGLNFRHTFGAKRLEYVLMTTGSGCALVDIDNDGSLDAFFVNGTYLDNQGNPLSDRTGSHALFHNLGNGSFKNVTDESGLKPSYGQGCIFADYDGDGNTDLYITNYGPNHLYRNKGDGTFEDVTESSGTGDPRYGTGATFFDYDGDGDLDLYVANFLKFRPDMKGVHASSLSKRGGFRFFPGPRDYQAEDDILYRNNGDGTFTDVSRESGLLPGGKGLTVVAGDFDNDGDRDLFVANDATPNFLYKNIGGRFEEVALTSGVAYDPDGAETAAMGVDVVDVDEDGLLDIYVTNMVFEFNNLYRNRGDLAFEDATRSFKLDRDNYRHVGWATKFADFNHDGQLDCFVANGHVVDYVEGFSQSITYPQRNMLFLGNNTGHFEDFGDRSGEDFRRKTVSRGAAFGDYDNDGDIDILISNSGGRAQLLRNDLPSNRNWIQIRLEGRSPNTHALGARLEIRYNDRSITSYVNIANTYLSSSDPTVHVGLSPNVSEADVVITWPSGTRSNQSVPAAQLTIIKEPETVETENGVE